MPDDTKKKKDVPKPEDVKLADAQGVTFVTGTGNDVTNPDGCKEDVCVQTKPGKPLEVTSTGTVDVNLKGAAIESRPVGALWKVLQRRTAGASFAAYKAFIDDVLCTPEATHEGLTFKTPAPLGVGAYQLLRIATEAYLLARTPTVVGLAEPRTSPATTEDTKIAADIQAYLGADNQFLPFIVRITTALTRDTNPDHFYCAPDSITDNVRHPYFLELIWSYWHEEGMLVQAINAISLRFQNKRGPGERDPLANLEIHYLRPLANILWGYIQDEDHRLTIARRAYEYEHEYGLPLVGKAVPHLRPADRRSRFLEAFHSLLHEAAVFYERASNLTVRADGFPMLNALREVHLILSEGAHNQFRDLPWTARVEMLIQQWLLARPEINAFLGGRQAVPYAEPWMGPVDTIRRLLGWGDTPVTHFRDLAVNGEQILLSIRFADWSVVNDEEEARGWAAAWKPEIQRYIHAYQAVTGVDLMSMSADKQMARQINAVPPSILLQQRLARQKAR